MIRVAWVRGKYLNSFEGQNYNLTDPDLSLTGFSSLHPLDESVPFPLIKLWSPADMPFFPQAARYIANRTIGDLQLLAGLERAVMDYDVLHTADPHYYYSYQLARLRKSFPDKRLIVTWWETIPFNNESTLAKKEIKNYVMKYTDRFIVYTKSARDALLSERVKGDRISLVHLGVDLERFAIARRRVSRIPTILFVGRFVEEKGVRDLYRAFKQLPRGSSRLRMVGSGPLVSEIRTHIERDRLSNHIEIKLVSYTEMPSLYADADIFVLPSRPTSTWEEQFGMVLAEAMASGLPVVTTSTGAIPEVVGQAAIQVEPGNVQQLTKALHQLVLKPDIREKVSQLGLKRATERFDSKKTAMIIGTIYKNEKNTNNRRHTGAKRRN